MIIDTMTIEEVANEIVNDWNENAYGYFMRVLASRNKKHRRMVIKSDSKKTIFFKPIEYRSVRNNRFVALPYSISQSDFKKRGLVSLYYATSYYKSQKYLFLIQHDMCNSLKFCTTIFVPHSLKRYTERCLKNTNVLVDENLYVEVLKRNATMYYEVIDTPKGKRECMEAEDGMFYGERINSRDFLIKTYISGNEFFNNQKIIHDKTTSEIEDYLEEKSFLNFTKLAS